MLFRSPHFEKMLYDQASLLAACTHAHQLTGAPHLHRVIESTVGYVLRDLATDGPGWASAEDADSEGIEGKFFVWTVQEIDAVLGSDDGQLFRTVFGVTLEGNFRDPHHPELTGRNVLSRPHTLDEIAFGHEDCTCNNGSRKRRQTNLVYADHGTLGGSVFALSFTCRC